MVHKYDNQQQIFCLSNLSNISSYFTGSKDHIQEEATKKIKAVLLDEEVKKLIGEWEVVWGPAVYQYDGAEGLDSIVADNSMYIAKSKDDSKSDHYVIAIAGANRRSWYAWMVESLLVGETKLWNNGQPWTDTSQDQKKGIRVSVGTSRGIQILYEEMQSSDKKFLLDYLKDLTSSASKPISIKITGHSLGNVLSSTLALSLMDRRSEWDSGDNVTLSVSPSGGPTAGNEQFALYYDNNLGGVTNRIWNKLDVVPYAWQQNLLEQISTLYDPNIQPNALINLFVDFAKSLSKDGEYQQICQNQNGFNIGYNIAAENNLINSSIDALSKWLAKLIVDALNLDKDLINVIAEAIASLIQILIPNSDSGKTISNQAINEIDVKPYIEKIIAELERKKSDLNTSELRNNLTRIVTLQNLLDFLKYLSQANYQHNDAYIEYLNVSEFISRIEHIIGTNQK